MRRNQFIYLITALVTLAGCDLYFPGDRPYRDELIGTFVANYDAGLKETIELKNDSTYAYVFISKDSSVYTYSGTWTLEYTNGADSAGAIVNLRNFSHPFDTSHEIYGMYVMKKAGKIKLERDPNRNQAYVKLDSANAKGNK